MPATPTTIGSGTITADGTEQTVASTTAAINAQAWVDLTNMQAGDTLVIKLKRKILSADGSETIVWQQTYSGAQSAGERIVVSLPLTCPHGATLTIQQTAGTNRSYKAILLSVGTPEVVNSGTVTTDGTEQTLHATGTAGDYVLVVDLTNLQNAETVVLRYYSKILAADGAVTLVWDETFSEARQAGEEIVVMLCVGAVNGATATIQRTAGGARSHKWSLERA